MKNKILYRLKSIISSPLIKALLFNTIVLLLIVLFCDMKYEVSDDFVMQSIIEGAYGNDYDPHLLFSNIILGYILKVFYRLIPSIGWYFVMHIVFCFISFSTISYVVLEASKDANRLQRKIIWISLLLFVGYFADDVYILVQFTKTAALTCFAGGVLVLYSFNNFKKKKRILGIIFGCILCLLGSMVRYNSMQIALMFLLAIYIKDGIAMLKKTKQKRHALKKLFFGFLISISIYRVAIGLNNVNGLLWAKSDEYKDYLYMNLLRASVTDVSGGDYENFRQTLMENGYTLEDTQMIESWEFVDQDYFNTDSIQKISQYRKAEALKTTRNIKDIILTLRDRQYYKYHICWIVLALLFISLIVNPKDWWLSVITVLICMFQLSYCVYGMRIVYRVEYCIFVCTAGALLYFIAMNWQENKRFAECYSKRSLYFVNGIIIFLIVAKIPLYIPDDSYKRMTDEEYNSYVESVLFYSGFYDIRKYKINLSKRPPYNGIITLMENDNENYYLCDFATTIQLLYYHYKPWESMPIGYYKDSYSYIGGVTSYFPGCYNVWAENGIDYINPFKSIANDNIRIVDNYHYLAKIGYYNEKYNPDAVEECVDVVDGMSIWKIR